MRMERQMVTDEEERPLDPASERVRRKLVRFVAINLGILFAAVMAVLGAVVYKSGIVGEQAAPAAPATLAPPSPAETPFVEAAIALPPGAIVLSQALSGERLSLHVRIEDGSEAIFVYHLAEKRMLGRYGLAAQ